MYTKFREFVDNEYVANDEGLELVELNTQNGNDTFYYHDDFRDAYFNYIIGKYKTNESLTDPNNNCQAMRAYNTIYLDGDWYFNESVAKTNYMNATIEIAEIYFNAWTEELIDNNVDDFYYFTFIPNEYPEGKGGFHVFIICNSIITQEMRTMMYNNIKMKLINGELNTIAQLIGIDDPNLLAAKYEKLFDNGPIKTATLLLPFAQKSKTSRQYKLHDTSFDYNSPQLYFIFPTQHRNGSLYGHEERQLTSDMSSLMNDDMNVIKELIDEMDRHANNKFNNIGNVGRVVANFMNSLVYLSPRHIFWKKMSDNGDRLRYIITPLIQFIYVNYFIERQGKVPDNTNNAFVHSLTRIMLPLLKMTTKNSNEKTQRDTYLSCYNHIKSYYNKYSQVKDIFDEETITFWREYCRLSAKEKKNLTYEASCLLKKIKRRFQKLFSNWTEFVTKIILAGMTDEIKPFRERINEMDDPRKGMTFDDVVPEQASVNTSASIDESFYIKTLRLWCLMFMFVEFYNTNSITETIRSILTAFSRYFIWYNKSISGNVKLYVYNIKQTKSLCKYPYNQWLLDTNDGECLKTWIKSIYLQMIKPELLTINKIVGIVPFLENLQNAQLIDGRLCTNMIKPLSNFDQDMEKMYKNILSTFAQERWDPPKELDAVSSPFFPMRNGLLEFLDNGDVKMHYDNHSRFMTIYTNVVWSDDYDYSCAEFRAVKRMWEQIFPVTDERNYSLQIFASTLTGSILKDMLIIPYGTGGDGKTISNNSILGMLGSDGLSSHIPLEENGKREYAENPCGLATTMKTETILVSSKSNHDSGGIVQLKNKRFCTVQEPDPNLSGGKLNCSKIKEILSGTTITAREIYQKAEAFTPNSVITLQTNLLLAYTEDTDAIRRRITVIPFRSKFTTAISEDKFDTLEYKFKADPLLSINLVNNPKYWQALFYVLLPFAQDLVRKGVKALSDIPRPRTIINATNESFAQSNGLVGWLNKNVVESSGHVLRVSDMVSIIMEAHNNERTKNGGILSSMKVRDRVIEIHSQLIGTYMGRIYKLRDEFYNKRKTDLVNGFALVVEEGDTNDSIISKYFEKYAVNNLERSDLVNKEDLYIVGYTLKTEGGDDGGDFV